jgi:hypothetical protein
MKTLSLPMLVGCFLLLLGCAVGRPVHVAHYTRSRVTVLAPSELGDLKTRPSVGGHVDPERSTPASKTFLIRLDEPVQTSRGQVVWVLVQSPVARVRGQWLHLEPDGLLVYVRDE